MNIICSECKEHPQNNIEVEYYSNINKILCEICYEEIIYNMKEADQEYQDQAEEIRWSILGY